LEFISFLAQLVKRNIPYCISEVSSHALALDRVAGLDFKVAVFTNLTQDHLDFHKTKKAYGEAKLKLFKNLTPSAFAVVNYDDKFAKKIIDTTEAKVIRYSLEKKCNICSEIKNKTLEGTEVFVYIDEKPKPLTINLPMLGQHNVYNMLAAIGTTKVLGIPIRFIKLGLEQLDTIPGRLERIKTSKGFDIYIDYAHTAEALSLAIRTLKEVTVGKIIVVFGCGGNRDRLKRPKMGKIATELGDYVIITSDNPRHEKQESIACDIKKGIKKDNYEVILGRRKAIRKAIALAEPKDTILIAGKGHEEYQIIGDKQIFFSDKKTVMQELKKI
jgi:UDP-N-acetylmuramoyl-L-alanyl-D-glutamate--2,6-diaminopimelate ligase